MNLEDIYALKAPQPYKPTLPFDGEVIDSYHRSLINAPLIDGTVKIQMPVKGSLRREDAAKIYELAHFAKGDVLDVGTNNGLSASILSEAINQKETSVFTIDFDQRLSTKAEENFQRLGLDNIISIVNDATSAVKQLLEKKNIWVCFC